jgi:hypothetical protein
VAVAQTLRELSNSSRPRRESSCGDSIAVRVGLEGRLIQLAFGLAPRGLIGDVDLLKAGLGEVAHQIDAPCSLRVPLVREVRRC